MLILARTGKTLFIYSCSQIRANTQQIEHLVLVVTLGIARQTKFTLDIQITIFVQQYNQLKRSTAQAVTAIQQQVRVYVFFFVFVCCVGLS